MLVDPSAPSIIAFATVATSAIGATAVGTYATLKTSRTPPATLAGLTALNSGTLCAAILTIREYVVSPGLLSAMSSGQYTGRRLLLEGHGSANSNPAFGQHLSYSDIRLYKTLDTGMSGALVGGAFSGWKRGVPKALRGAATGALVCTILQYFVNEGEVARVKYVAKRMPDSARDAAAHTSHSHLPAPEESGSSPFTATMGIHEGPQSSQPSFPQRLFNALGLFHKVSDEQYLELLKHKRDGYLARMKDLEEIIEGETKGKGS